MATWGVANVDVLLGLEVRATVRDVLDRAAEQFLGLRLHYLGAVPVDPAVRQAVRDQVPVLNSAPQSQATRALIKLADRLRN